MDAGVCIRNFILASIFVFLFIAPPLAALEIKAGESGDLTVYLVDSSYKPAVGATCTIDIYFPNNTIIVNDGAMTDLSNGFYNYGYTGTSVTGDYKAIANCTYAGDERTTARMFSVVNKTIEERVSEDVWNFTNRNLTYYATGIVSVTEAAVGGYRNQTFFSCHPNHVLANETPEDDAKMYRYAWMEHNIFIEDIPANITDAEVCFMFKREGTPTGNVTIYLNDVFLQNHTIDAEPTYYHWDCANITDNITTSMEFRMRMPPGLTLANNYNWGLDAHERKGYSHYSTVDPPVWQEYYNGEFIAYVRIESYETGTGEVVWSYATRNLTDYNQSFIVNNFNTLWEHFNCSNATVLTRSVCEYLIDTATTVEETHDWIDPLREDIEKIPGIKNVVNGLSTSLQTMGMNINTSLIVSVIIISLLLVIAIIGIVYLIYLRTRGIEEAGPEEETLLLGQ